MLGEARSLRGVVDLDRSVRVGTKEVDVSHQALHFNVSTESKARACVSDAEIGATGANRTAIRADVNGLTLQPIPVQSD